MAGLLRNPVTRGIRRGYDRMLDGLIRDPVVRERPLLHTIAPMLLPLQRARLKGMESYISCVDKGDGAGAQVQAVFSTMLFAHDMGLTYAHTPFGHMDHGEGTSDWSAKWEAFMNLGHDELAATDVEKDISKVIALPSLGKLTGSDDTLYKIPHCHTYADRNAENYKNIKERLIAKYESSPKDVDKLIEPGRFNVALHLRRGDVNMQTYPDRYTPDAFYLKIVENLKAVLNVKGIEPMFHVFSQGSEDGFSEYRKRGMRLHINACAFASYHALVQADVLIMARSSFSYTAGLLSRGTVLYNPFWHRPLPDWVTIDASGGFAREALERRLD